MRSNKKVFYSIIVCAIIIVVSAGTSIYHYHELHKYDGIWEATRYSSEDDYLDIDSRKVTYYIGKLDDRSYAFVYYGKIKDDKIIFTKVKRTYYSYLLDDYNYKKMSHVKISCKFKVSNNTLHMDDEKFKKSKK